MSYTLLIHLIGEAALMCEAEQLPNPSDSTITVTHLRQRDGKEVSMVDSNATSFIFPWSRVNFIEILGSEEEEEIVGFARD
ncbi:MAG TPA: hypothetical protein VII92_13435 [Anaerolineae bacterium]